MVPTHAAAAQDIILILMALHALVCVYSCVYSCVLWGAVGSCGELWGAVRSCGELWGAVRSCGEL